MMPASPRRLVCIPRFVWFLIVTLALPFSATVALAEPLPRFFFSGDGNLAIENAHTNEKIAVGYRRADGTYDDAALARIRHVFRSRSDQKEGPVSLRLVELLGYVQSQYRPKQMILVSGYRSPELNASLAGVAESSLHTQGLAADVMLPGIDLKRTWIRLREAQAGGVGYYATDKFLHIDTGQPRFWEKSTSRVGEKLAAGNARVFARTDFDRHKTLIGAEVRLYNITAVPLRVARKARLVGYSDAVVRLQPIAGDEDGDCIVIRKAGEPYAINIAAIEHEPQTGARRTRIALSTCEPRLEATAATIETNEIEIGR